MVDKSRVIKLLNLTRSENNNEALVAMRRVNAMVSSWEEFLGGGSNIRQEIARNYGETRTYTAPKPHEWEASVEEMLQDCIDQVTGKGADFIASLDAHYRRRGSLSERQHAALKKFYDKLGLD